MQALHRRAGGAHPLDGSAAHHLARGLDIGARRHAHIGAEFAVEMRLIEIAAGYFPPVLGGDYVVPPALGQQAGICGALLLASSGNEG